MSPLQISGLSRQCDPEKNDDRVGAVHHTICESQKRLYNEFTSDSDLRRFRRTRAFEIKKFRFNQTSSSLNDLSEGINRFPDLILNHVLAIPPPRPILAPPHYGPCTQYSNRAKLHKPAIFILIAKHYRYKCAFQQLVNSNRSKSFLRRTLGYSAGFQLQRCPRSCTYRPRHHQRSHVYLWTERTREF